MKTILFILIMALVFPTLAQENPEEKTQRMISSVSTDRDHQDAIREMSSMLMKAIMDKSKGDPKQMQSLMNRAQQNPDKFIKEMMTPEQQKLIRQLASEIEAQEQKQKLEQEKDSKKNK